MERGQVLLRLKNIPEAQLPTLIEALMDSLSPVRRTPQPRGPRK